MNQVDIDAKFEQESSDTQEEALFSRILYEGLINPESVNMRMPILFHPVAKVQPQNCRQPQSPIMMTRCKMSNRDTSRSPQIKS
jgi:hypothetical protein